MNIPPPAFLSPKLLLRCLSFLSPDCPLHLSVWWKRNAKSEKGGTESVFLRVPRRTQKRRNKDVPCDWVKNESYVWRAPPGWGSRLAVDQHWPQLPSEWPAARFSKSGCSCCSTTAPDNEATSTRSNDKYMKQQRSDTIARPISFLNNPRVDKDMWDWSHKTSNV